MQLMHMISFSSKNIYRNNKKVTALHQHAMNDPLNVISVKPFNMLCQESWIPSGSEHTSFHKRKLTWGQYHLDDSEVDTKPTQDFANFAKILFEKFVLSFWFSFHLVMREWCNLIFIWRRYERLPEGNLLYRREMKI